MDANNTVEITDIEQEDNTPKLPAGYEKHHYLIVHGKVKHISHSSAYILDMLTKEE